MCRPFAYLAAWCGACLIQKLGWKAAGNWEGNRPVARSYEVKLPKHITFRQEVQDFRFNVGVHVVVTVEVATVGCSQIWPTWFLKFFQLFLNFRCNRKTKSLPPWRSRSRAWLAISLRQSIIFFLEDEASSQVLKNLSHSENMYCSRTTSFEHHDVTY